jgi:4-diphosphocytidyl-2-C-methyl-D-erythritol kinase
MPDAIREFAPAKINLALHVLGRRDDGYHELDSIVAFADVGDHLVIAPSTEFSIEASGPFAGALPQARDNIIRKAWQEARAIATQQGSTLPPLRVELTKNLPVASGIGGGSADAAAMLRGCLRLAEIDQRGDEVLAAALRLGADVPVCFLSKAARMRGIGQNITPLQDFAPLHAVLVNPGVAVQTSAVFAALGLKAGERLTRSSRGTGRWRNDLTAPALAVAPVIAAVLDALAPMPARLSGSGATCFALYPDAETARAAAARLSRDHPGYWVTAARLG